MPYGVQYWLDEEYYFSAIIVVSYIAALQKGSAKDSIVMHLLRCLWFFVAHYDIVLTSEHIAGTDTVTAQLTTCLETTCILSFLLIHRLHPSQHQCYHSSSNFSQSQDQIGPQQPSSSCLFLLSERTSPLHSNTLPGGPTEIH